MRTLKILSAVTSCKIKTKSISLSTAMYDVYHTTTESIIYINHDINVFIPLLSYAI